MNSTDYELFRNELIDILTDVIGIENMEPTIGENLRRVCRRTREDQFAVVLAGEFQSGKSTLFNALCDGRPLSPTGSGLKTSGCVLMAQNIADPDAPERVDVRWRTSQELVDGFSDLLMHHFKALDENRFKNITASELGREIDMRKPTDRALVLSAVSEEMTVWLKDKQGYDPMGGGKLDTLRMAWITAAYYGDERLDAVRNSQGLRPEQAGKMIIFPDGWERRWSENDPSAFDVSEVLFAFIHHVRLHIHSRNLGRTGCVIVDCPGLLSGRWDTQVARRAMIDADTILYVIDGFRTLKLSDMTSLWFIRDNGMSDKLLFGFNMRGHSLVNSCRIMESDRSLLEKNGFSVDQDRWAQCHAFLAMKAVQARALENRSVQPSSEHRGERENLDDLIKGIKHQLTVLEEGTDLNTGISGMDIINAAEKAGQLRRLSVLIENKVLGDKAKAVLIANGAAPAVNYLLEYESSLHSRERAAIIKENAFFRQVQQAQQELNAYRNKCMQIVERLDDAEPDKMLADDFRVRLLACRHGLSERITRRILDEIVILTNIAILWDRQRLHDRLSALIKEEIDRQLDTVTCEWLSEIRARQNDVYNQKIMAQVQSINHDLLQVWQASSLPRMEIFDGVVFPEFTGNLELDETIVFQELEAGKILENIRYNVFLAGSLAGVFSAMSGVAAGVSLFLSRVVWITVASSAALLANAILIYWAKDKLKSTLKDDINDRLRISMNRFFSDMETECRQEIEHFSAEIRKIYRHAFLNIIKRPENIFKQRKQQLESDLKKTGREKEAVAEECKKIRQQQIQPLRMRLQQFCRNVEQAEAGRYSKPGNPS